MSSKGSGEAKELDQGTKGKISSGSSIFELSSTSKVPIEDHVIIPKKQLKLAEKKLLEDKSLYSDPSKDCIEDVEMKGLCDNDSENRKSESSDNHMDLVHEERKLTLEVSSDIYCIEIFHSVFDTSQSFKIHKYLVKEESIKALKDYLPENFKIVSFYGIAEVIKDCLNKIFETDIPVFPSTEGIYLFYSPTGKVGALVFITENEEIYKLKPIKSSSPFVTIIRTLTDLSFKIVACLSEDIIENWFYEEGGILNPFKPKVHQSGGIMLKEVTVQESKIEQIELLHEGFGRFNYYMTKDNLNFFFHYNFEEISEHERLELRKIIQCTCDELVKLNHVHMFHFEIIKVLTKMKMLSFNVQELTQKLKHSLEQMISNRKQSREELIRKISAQIEEVFIYNQSFHFFYNYQKDRNLESIIKGLLEINTIIDSEKIFTVLNNSLSSNLKLKKEFSLDDIVEKYFKNYQESVTIVDIEDILDQIVKDIRNVVEIKDELRFYGWKLSSRIKGIAKELFNERKTNIIEFQKCIKNKLNSYLGDSKHFALKKIISSLVEDHLQIVSVIEKSFKDTSYSYLSDIEKNSLGIEFHLKKTEFEVSEKYNKQLICKIGSNFQVFRQFFPSKNLIVSQIISLEPEVIFVLISNAESNKTHILRFNPIVIYKDDYEKCEDINDSEVIIAWGSSANKFIMFQNMNKIASHGSLKYNKYFEKGVQLDIYSKIDKVKSSFYLKKSRKFFIIDTNGIIYSKDLVNEESEICIVKSNKRVDGNDGELEPLRPKNGNRFLDIDISADENILLLRTETDIECFDKNFIQTHSIPIPGNFLAY